MSIHQNDSPMRILVRRTGALGDVLITTPVVERLAEEHPRAEIDFDTAYPAVYAGNTRVMHLGIRPGVVYDRIIDLNMSYEKTRGRVPTMDAYMDAAFRDRGGPRSIVFAHGHVPELNVNWDRTVVCHPARSWENRSLSREWWQLWVEFVDNHGYQCVVTGTDQDHDLGYPAVDLRNKLSLADQAALIERAVVFVASASGPLALAYSTSTPIVSMFSVSRPELDAYERRGKPNWGVWALLADVSCAGCAAELSEPVTYFGCRYGTNACMRSFDPKAVADITLEAIEWGRLNR